MAFYFDRAVVQFGLEFEADLQDHIEEATDTGSGKSKKKAPTRKQLKQRHERRVALWLGDEDQAPRMYADPMLGMRR